MSGDELEFDAAEFQKMSHKQKVRICRRFAVRAREMGAVAPSEHRTPYTDRR
jgi:hypothetical protein